MFAPRYFAFHYYASRYFPPAGMLAGDVLRICLLNMQVHTGSLAMTADTGTLTMSMETGSINMLTRCR